MRKQIQISSVLMALALSWSGGVHAMFMMPDLIPTERILKNTQAFLAKNPESADAHYTIARIHYLTFTNRMWLVQGWETRSTTNPPRIAPDFLLSYGGGTIDQARQAEAARRVAEKIDKKRESEKFYQAVNEEVQRLKEENWSPPTLSAEEILTQADLAGKAFEKAIQLDPKNSLYLLGKASLQEQTATFLKENPDLAPVSLPLDDLSPESILRSYHQAYEAARDEDLRQKFLPVSGLTSLVSHEAGNAILRMAKAHPEAADKVEDLRLRQVEKDLKKLKNLKMGAITPIILSDAPEIPLSDLIRKSPVHFDVDGDGRKEKLDSWPNERAGLLVWDPDETGQVTSGRQWFGTFGFQMLWRNGYQALDALDDSRDGWLAGEELRGISLWRDTNGNAISDPGEVHPLNHIGITGIATHPESPDALQNREGVVRSDGSITASHDWIFKLIE